MHGYTDNVKWQHHDIDSDTQEGPSLLNTHVQLRRLSSCSIACRGCVVSANSNTLAACQSTKIAADGPCWTACARLRGLAEGGAVVPLPFLRAADLGHPQALLNDVRAAYVPPDKVHLLGNLVRVPVVARAWNLATYHSHRRLRVWCPQGCSCCMVVGAMGHLVKPCAMLRRQQAPSGICPFVNLPIASCETAMLASVLLQPYGAARNVLPGAWQAELARLAAEGAEVAATGPVTMAGDNSADSMPEAAGAVSGDVAPELLQRVRW